MVVYGGAASIWGYEGDFGVKYDVMMATMVDMLRRSDRYDAEIVRGVQLGASKPIDRMWASLVAGSLKYLKARL